MAGEGARQMAIVEQLGDGCCLTTAELAGRTGYPRKSVADACCRLITRGWVQRRERGCFDLTGDGLTAHAAGETITSGPKGALTQGKPRQPNRRTGRDRIWKAIRILGKFTLAEIAAQSEQSIANVRSYVRALERTGYLVPLRREAGAAPTSNGFSRWALIKNPGPLAPVWRVRTRTVYDPNSGQSIEVPS